VRNVCTCDAEYEPYAAVAIKHPEFGKLGWGTMGSGKSWIVEAGPKVAVPTETIASFEKARASFGFGGEIDS